MGNEQVPRRVRILRMRHRMLPTVAICTAGRDAMAGYKDAMRCVVAILLVGIGGSLSGCGAEVLGVGSLVMQGLQLAGGGGESGGQANMAPFRPLDHSAEQRALEDVTTRAVSQACQLQLPDKDAYAKGDSSTATASGGPPAPRRRCGYQPICLPGHSKPVTMLVCETS